MVFDGPPSIESGAPPQEEPREDVPVVDEAAPSPEISVPDYSGNAYEAPTVESPVETEPASSAEENADTLNKLEAHIMEENPARERDEFLANRDEVPMAEPAAVQEETPARSQMDQALDERLSAYDNQEPPSTAGIEVEEHPNEDIENVVLEGDAPTEGHHSEEPGPESQEEPPQPDVPEDEFKRFISNGEVTEERVRAIAEKMKSGEPLSPQEQDMRIARANDVETYLSQEERIKRNSEEAQEKPVSRFTLENIGKMINRAEARVEGEGGWMISGITRNGDIVVSKKTENGDERSRHVTLDELNAWEDEKDQPSPKTEAPVKFEDPGIKATKFEEARNTHREFDKDFVMGALERTLQDPGGGHLLHMYDYFVKTTPDNIEVEISHDPERIAKLHSDMTQMISENLKINLADEGLRDYVEAQKSAYLRELTEEDKIFSEGAKNHSAGDKLPEKFMSAHEYRGFKMKTAGGEIDISQSGGERAPGVEPNIKVQRGGTSQFVHWKTSPVAESWLKGEDVPLTRRIYLNPSTPELIGTFSQIMKGLEQDGIRARGKVTDRSIELFKRATDTPKSVRSEGIVLYLEDKDANNVLQKILKMQEDRPELFANRSTPKIATEVAPGIAIGDEPKNGESLTENRVKLIESALNETREKIGIKFGEKIPQENAEKAYPLFNETLKRIAKENGVDPNNIAFNLEGDVIREAPTAQNEPSREAAFVDEETKRRREAEAKEKEAESISAPAAEAGIPSPPAVETNVPEPSPEVPPPPVTEAQPQPETTVEKFTGFAGQYAKDMYEKLGTVGKHIAEGLYMRARHNTVDRFKILYHEKLMGYHDFHNERLDRKHTDVEKEIAQLKKFQRTGNTSFEAQYGDGKKLSPRQVERKLEKLEYKKDNLETRMKRRDSKMMIREVHRAEISNAYREDIYEHCSPHREKLANFEEQRDRVTEEISHFGERIAQDRKDIEAIEATLRDELLTPEEKERRRAQIDMVKKEIQESKRVMKEKVARRAKIQHRMVRAEKRLDVWRDRSNAAARVAKRSVPYQSVEKRRLAFESGQQDVAVDNVPEEEVTGFHVPEADGQEEEPGGDYETLEEGTLTLQNFASAWNKEFGSEGHVNPKAFAELLPAKEGTDVYTKDEMETAMYKYLPTIQDNMRLRRSVKMNAADLQKKLKMFWAHQNV